MRMGLLARAMRKPVQDGGLHQGGISMAREAGDP